jgi:hypothetical protein
MIALLAVALLATVAVSLITPAASAADDERTGLFADIRGESYIVATGKTITYTIYADGGSEPIGFRASLRDSGGNTVGSISAQGRATTVDMEGVVLTVTAPSTPGTYTLTVEFTFTDIADTKTTVTKTAPVKAVKPVTLTATVYNTGDGGTIYDMEVWFEVDGVRVDGSERPITINAGSNQKVTYEWATDTLSNGAHTVTLRGQVGPNDYSVEGLNDPMAFYVGQKSYSLIETILIIMLIVMLIILFIVFRKPVKNFGKPKGRR